LFNSRSDSVNGRGDDDCNNINNNTYYYSYIIIILFLRPVSNE